MQDCAQCSKQTLDIIGICIGSNHVPLYCQFSIYSESLLYHPMKKIDIECFTEPTEIYLFVWLEELLRSGTAIVQSISGGNVPTKSERVILACE